MGFVCVLGEAAANLLEPWPLNVVLDNVLINKGEAADVLRWIHSLVGADKMAILKFACLAVIDIAALDAVRSYGEKYLTTTTAAQ